jgi:diguanylate cyclase (GGDEF)-like protein
MVAGKLAEMEPHRWPSTVAALQPVVRLLDGTVLGYQALWRDTAGAAPRTMDTSAAGDDAELDLAQIQAALACAKETHGATLFIEVPATSLLRSGATGDLSQLAADAHMTPGKVVLELSERVPVADVGRLREIVAELHAGGFLIGSKDAGARHSSMLMIAEVRPDFIKVGRELTRGVHASAARRALVVSLLSLGTHINAALIAEGIDKAADLRALIDLGIQFGQGDQLEPPVAVAPDSPAGRDMADPGWFPWRRVDGRAADQADGSERRSVAGGTGVAGTKLASLPHALSRAALALQAEHDPQRILAVIAEQLSLVVPVDDLSIYEADHTSHRFVAAFATGPQAQLIMADVFSMSVGLNGWAFSLGTPQNLANAGAHPAATTIPNTPFEHESLLLIPLVAGDHKLGMLNCRRMGLNRFTDDDLEAASLFGHTAAAAWHNAQLYEELARRAMTDGLTGLFNSRWLREAGARELADCQRRGTPLSVVLIDLDYFKRINDTGGHAAGDVVLQRVADELRRTTRAGDAAVRLGGEEFILMLRDSDAAGALRVADDLRTALTRVPVPADCAGIHRITASIGIASFPEHASSLADLVRAADVAMYLAKRDGRDRVTVALPSGAMPGETGTAA